LQQVVFLVCGRVFSKGEVVNWLLGLQEDYIGVLGDWSGGILEWVFKPECFFMMLDLFYKFAGR